MPTYIKWPTPIGGVKLEYAPEILERLRLLSIDGLLALPRFGMSIGGFLTGSVDQGRVRVSEAIDIPCSHANGPGFALTGPELAKASSMAFGEGRRQVVGWYCSKPRGEMVLDSQQARLFSEICPELWQVGLIIRPSTVEATRAAMCIRVSGQDYAVGQAMELIEYSPPIHQLPVEEVVSEIVPLEDEPAVKPPLSVPLVAADFAKPIFVNPEPVKPEPTRPEFVKPAPTKPEFVKPEFAKPEFVVPPVPEIPPPVSQARPVRVPFGDETRYPPVPTGWSMRRYLLVALAALAVIVILYLNRFSFITRPPLEIRISEAAGQITLEWNPEALEGIDEGTVVLNDGGQFQTIALNRKLLASGWLRSPRKSGRVIAKLTAGDVTGLGSWTGAGLDDGGQPHPPDSGVPASQPANR